MSKRDYYEILSVTRTVTDDELKKSYRRLAIQFHPDRNPGDSQAEASFKEINEAYQILSDPKKRAAYDQFGTQDWAARVSGAGDLRAALMDRSPIFLTISSAIFLVGRLLSRRRGSISATI